MKFQNQAFHGEIRSPPLAIVYGQGIHPTFAASGRDRLRRLFSFFGFGGPALEDVRSDPAVPAASGLEPI